MYTNENETLKEAQKRNSPLVDYYMDEIESVLEDYYMEEMEPEDIWLWEEC